MRILQRVKIIRNFNISNIMYKYFKKKERPASVCQDAPYGDRICVMPFYQFMR